MGLPIGYGIFRVITSMRGRCCALPDLINKLASIYDAAQGAGVSVTAIDRWANLIKKGFSKPPY